MRACVRHFPGPRPPTAWTDRQTHTPPTSFSSFLLRHRFPLAPSLCLSLSFPIHPSIHPSTYIPTHTLFLSLIALLTVFLQPPPPPSRHFALAMVSSKATPQQTYSLADIDHGRTPTTSPLTDAQKAHATFVEPGHDSTTTTSSSTNSTDSSPSFRKPTVHGTKEKEWQPSGTATPAGVHELLVDELFPADSYYQGTYWADLPRGREFPHTKKNPAT